ncbi:protein kinase [Microbacterium sp. NPDC096154]|uniref:serine/threonine-protein kinase n=1 Tax=Microbacterium sp. NPDC096154 TaxID=3155549 RepID=UPI003328B94E
MTPDAPTPDPDATAALLDGRYRLIECVGAGGMSRVYRAEDVTLGRIVAVKMLHADVDGGSAERARGEVAVLASLSHPALVTLFDAHVVPGKPDYLVMEYVDGPTLGDVLREGPLAPGETAGLATELAEGLHAAHRAGIVHRDIKPSNVLLSPTDLPDRRFHAKLADFGIAYLLDGDRVTSPGMVVGTAAYIAPEQARGEAPTPAADIYALGLVLLEALTGASAFPKTTPVASLVARQTTAPVIPASVPPGWAGLLGRMTATDPAERPSAAAVAGETSALAGRFRGAAAAASPDDRTQPLTGIVAAGAGAALGAGAGAASADAATEVFDLPGTTPNAVTADAPAGATSSAPAADTQVLAPASAAGAAAGAGWTGSGSSGGDVAAGGPRKGGSDRRRRRGVLLTTGALAAVAAASLGAWALGEGGTPDPTRTVAPVTEPTESPSPSVAPAGPADAPAQDDAPAPVAPDEDAQKDAQKKAEEQRKKAEEEQRKADQEARKAAEEQRKAEEEAQRKAEEEQRKAQEEAEKAAEEQAEEEAADEGDDAIVETPAPGDG